MEEPMLKTIPATTLRNHLSDALKAVDLHQKYLVITKKDKPISVLVDLDFFEELLASHSPRYLASIRQARGEYKRHRTFTHQEVFGNL